MYCRFPPLLKRALKYSITAKIYSSWNKASKQGLRFVQAYAECLVVQMKHGS